MNDIFFKCLKINDNNNLSLIEEYDNLKEAEKQAQLLANKNQQNVEIFKAVSITKIKPDSTVVIDTFESACEYLNIPVKITMIGVTDKYIKAMYAMYKLFVIAEAWNKQDGFVPDFSDRYQYKYFPYNCISLCLKTEQRAKSFGQQFINLWNDIWL